MNRFKIKVAIYVLLMVSVLLTACTREVNPPQKEPLKRPEEAFLKYGDTNDTIVELSKINNSVWIHTSYHEQNGSLVSSNGLLLVTDEGLLLIDTPWTPKQTESLDTLVREAFNGSITRAVITHAHIDRMGGISYLKEKKIPITSLEVVAEAAIKNGFDVPDQIVEGDLAVINAENTKIEIFYPGPGHSVDNTVVWIDKYNLLFGGCIIKEIGSNSLGNTDDSDLESWPDSIKSLQERYPNAEIVIPGHGQWGDSDIFAYTLELLEE